MIADATHRIERLLRTEQWMRAHRLIYKHLAREPLDHWLWARLALTYYEAKDYKRAHEASSQAVELAPGCPLALWEYAGALSMLGKHREGKRVYVRLIRRGAVRIARGPCGEGLGRARSLVNDCRYRVAFCCWAVGESSEAVRYLRAYLRARERRVWSIYRVADVRRELRDYLGALKGAKQGVLRQRRGLGGPPPGAVGA